MKRLTVVAVICLTLFSTYVLSTNDQTTVVIDEKYFHNEKQKSYKTILSKLPPLIESAQDQNSVSYSPTQHVAITITLKETILDSRFRGKGGIEIYQDSPTDYTRLIRKLISVMADLPPNSYIDFTFIKSMMYIETRLTKEGIDYLYSRDDVLIDEVLRVKFL